MFDSMSLRIGKTLMKKVICNAYLYIMAGAVSSLRRNKGIVLVKFLIYYKGLLTYQYQKFSFHLSSNTDMHYKDRNLSKSYLIFVT